MANTRKLLGEIDRALKKISEGVEVFDLTWDKLYSTSQQSQKEKYESDLKKEIKKLQRFREQLKNWMGSTEVKDKKPLIDARKTIESKMEQFKVCERETKTKAYSKEGIAIAQRGESMDPQEKAKQNTRSWVQDFLSQLNEQLESYESDIESLNPGAKGKKQNKKEIQDLNELIARHKWHIQKLEQATRLLDNDALLPQTMDKVKDDVEYYIEANHDPDYMENYGEDDIYAALDMDHAVVSSGIMVGVIDRDTTQNVEEASSTKIAQSTFQETQLGDVSNSFSIPFNKSAGPSRPQPQHSMSQQQAYLHQQQPIPRQSNTQHQDIRQANEAAAGESFNDPVTMKLSNRNPTVSTPQHQSESINQRPVISEDHRMALHMLDSSLAFLPESRVLPEQRVSTYIPRNPYASPACFPTTPAALFENSSIFEKFDTDTLFFVFYFQQGSYQQFLAARELKKQTWAYHKKYLTWFKRHEEPKITCEEYEQGTYVYFDYETGWCQRIKSEFTFEYSYLEDEL